MFYSDVKCYAGANISAYIFANFELLGTDYN